MALDNDGYDNILDPNTMESLPKLSGFGSGNLSGSNLYIPIYNSITQEYQKLTVQDVQPDYTGVKNSLLADAITTNAAPATLPNLIVNPNMKPVWNQTKNSSESGMATDTSLVRVFGEQGLFSGWAVITSSGTVSIDATSYNANSTFMDSNDPMVLTGTLTNGAGPWAIRLPSTSTSAQAGYKTLIGAQTTQTLRGNPVSFSFLFRSTDTTSKVCAAIVADTDNSVSIRTPSIVFGASNAPPTATGTQTLLATTSTAASSTATWQRVTLENITVPLTARTLFVVIYQNTAVSGTSPIRISGIFLHKGTKAAVYCPDANSEQASADSVCFKVSESDLINTNANPTVPNRYTRAMGAWTTTTNFRIMLPYFKPMGRSLASQAQLPTITVGFTGTIGNIVVEDIVGATFAASAWTSYPRTSGLELNITTAASVAGAVGWLRTVNASTHWCKNYWYVEAGGNL